MTRLSALFALLTTLALSQGCNLVPNDDTNGGGGVNDYGEAPMELPLSFYVTGTFTSEHSVFGPNDGTIDQECPIVTVGSGRAATYCGIPIEVWADGYVFDSKVPYLAYTWHGTYTIVSTGSGDLDGAAFRFEGVDEEGGQSYWLEYALEHN